MCVYIYTYTYTYTTYTCMHTSTYYLKNLGEFLRFHWLIFGTPTEKKLPRKHVSFMCTYIHSLTYSYTHEIYMDLDDQEDMYVKLKLAPLVYIYLCAYT